MNFVLKYLFSFECCFKIFFFFKIGYNRAEIREKPLSLSNVQIVDALTQDASCIQLAAGFSEVPTLKSIQNLRSELLSAADKDADDTIDMVKRSMDEEMSKFIRAVKLPKLTVMLFKDAQINILLQFVSSSKFRRANLDATGSIIRAIGGMSVLHHVLMVPIQVAQDKGKVPFNLAEMLTVDQSAHNIQFFLAEFLKGW